MGLRAAFWRLMAKGSPPRHNEFEQRDLITTSLFEAPLLIAELADHGIDAVLIESFNVVTKTRSDARVLVRHGDLEAARGVLASRSTD